MVVKLKKKKIIKLKKKNKNNKNNKNKKKSMQKGGNIKLCQVTFYKDKNLCKSYNATDKKILNTIRNYLKNNEKIPRYIDVDLDTYNWEYFLKLLGKKNLLKLKEKAWKDLINKLEKNPEKLEQLSFKQGRAKIYEM